MQVHPRATKTNFSRHFLMEWGKNGVILVRCTPAGRRKKIFVGSFWLNEEKKRGDWWGVLVEIRLTWPCKRRWWLKKVTRFLVRKSAPPEKILPTPMVWPITSIDPSLVLEMMVLKLYLQTVDQYEMLIVDVDIAYCCYVCLRNTKKQEVVTPQPWVEVSH